MRVVGAAFSASSAGKDKDVLSSPCRPYILATPYTYLYANTNTQ